MKRLTIAGLTLVLACSPSRELPDFTISSPTIEEQVSSNCFRDSDYSIKMSMADSILTQVAQYEIAYGANLDLSYLNNCEKQLIFLLTQPITSQFSDIVPYKYDNAWVILKNLKKTELSNSNVTLSD
ncbi:hypothetical protein J4471_02820 [Candidatus Woesearchaeota archaeon]|nr:hypothetical protein [Candidatus Woesearchaeota archaeon]